MQGQKKCKLNNKGVTLIELVVVILMMGLISMMLVVFVSTSRVSYQSVSTEIQLQDEASFAMSYIEEIAVEAKYCSPEVKTVNFEDGSSMDVFYILAPDTETVITSEKNYYYFIALERETGTLRFIRLPEPQKGEEDPAVICDLKGDVNIKETLEGRRLYGNSRKLLAKNVKVFRGEDGTIEKGGLDVNVKDNLIEVKIVFELMDKEYTSDKIFLGRNIKTEKEKK